MKNIPSKITLRKERTVKDAYMSSAGPVDFKSRISEREGDIMTIASRDVITAPPTSTIIGTIKTMLKHEFRRIPLADAGTNRLVGIVTSTDIVDFLGGGQKHNLVANKFNGNILSAINASVSDIMEENVIYLNDNDSLKNALNSLINQNVGGLPITDDNKVVKAIISEKDFVWLVADIVTNKTIDEYISRKVVTASPNTTIGDATKTMIGKGFRRLPVLRDDILVGVVTASDILRFLGSGEIFNKLITGNVKEVFSVPIKTLIKREAIFSNSGIDIGEAAGIMLRQKVGCLPIIDDSILIGILTERDVIRSLAD